MAIFLGCSAEAVDEQQMNSLNAVGTTATEPVADITSGDLEGRWELSSMTSDVSLDLNGDNEKQTNIMAETSCFHSMYFVFDTNNNVETNQARLYFDQTGNFTCSEKVYLASYEVSGDILAITFSVKGSTYTENRKIAIENDGKNDFLKMSLTGAETDAAVYVEDGRENTVAKEIGKIDFLFIKK